MDHNILRWILVILFSLAALARNWPLPWMQRRGEAHDLGEASAERQRQNAAQFKRAA